MQDQKLTSEQTAKLDSLRAKAETGEQWADICALEAEMLKANAVAARPTIQLRKREVYGNVTFYPIDQTAKDFAELLGQKTITNRDMALIERIGFTIQFVM